MFRGRYAAAAAAEPRTQTRQRVTTAAATAAVVRRPATSIGVKIQTERKDTTKDEDGDVDMAPKTPLVITPPLKRELQTIYSAMATDVLPKLKCVFKPDAAVVTGAAGTSAGAADAGVRENKVSTSAIVFGQAVRFIEQQWLAHLPRCKYCTTLARVREVPSAINQLVHWDSRRRELEMPEGASVAGGRDWYTNFKRQRMFANSFERSLFTYQNVRRPKDSSAECKFGLLDALYGNVELTSRLGVWPPGTRFLEVRINWPLLRIEMMLQDNELVYAGDLWWKISGVSTGDDKNAKQEGVRITREWAWQDHAARKRIEFETKYPTGARTSCADGYNLSRFLADFAAVPSVRPVRYVMPRATRYQDDDESCYARVFTSTDTVSAFVDEYKASGTIGGEDVEAPEADDTPGDATDQRIRSEHRALQMATAIAHSALAADYESGKMHREVLDDDTVAACGSCGEQNINCVAESCVFCHESIACESERNSHFHKCAARPPYMALFGKNAVLRTPLMSLSAGARLTSLRIDMSASLFWARVDKKSLLASGAGKDASDELFSSIDWGIDNLRLVEDDE